jgi:hypothetical protein
MLLFLMAMASATGPFVMLTSPPLQLEGQQLQEQDAKAVIISQFDTPQVMPQNRKMMAGGSMVFSVLGTSPVVTRTSQLSFVNRKSSIHFLWLCCATFDSLQLLAANFQQENPLWIFAMWNTALTCNLKPISS